MPHLCLTVVGKTLLTDMNNSPRETRGTIILSLSALKISYVFRQQESITLLFYQNVLTSLSTCQVQK